MTDQFDQFKIDLVALVPRLRRFALVLSQSSHTADDLVQSAVERALTRYHQWRVGSRVDTWVFTILHSIWKNELRARAIRQGRGFVDADTLPDESPTCGVERTILLDQVYKQVNALPEAQREAMVLVYVEGYAYAEAAAILGIPGGTLMSRLARARASLAINLESLDHSQQVSKSSS